MSGVVFNFNGEVFANNIDLSGTGRIKNVTTTPVASTDAVNKEYVDAVAVGLGPKNAVHAKTTIANLATFATAGIILSGGPGAGKRITAGSNGVLTIDTISPAIGQRILYGDVADTAPSTNVSYGIYVVIDAGSAGTPWIIERATDCDNSPGPGEVVTGIYTLVQYGATHVSSGWSLLTTGTITVDVTAQSWGQITSAGAGATTLDGLSDAYKTANTINLGNAITTLPTFTTIISSSFINGAMTGTNNTIIGSGVAGVITTGMNNVCMGYAAGFTITTGSNNLVLGASAGFSVMSGNNNICIGHASGQFIDSGSTNIVIGRNVCGTLTTGSNNIIIGSGTTNVSLNSITNCIAFGNNVIASVASGLFFPTTLAVLAAPTINASRIMVYGTTTGQTGPIADGAAGQVLQTNGSGILSWATAGGATSLDGLSDAYKTADKMIIGNTVTAVPSNSLIISPSFTNATMSGTYNMIIGHGTGNSLTTGNNNTIIGNDSGNFLTTGANNTLIGQLAGVSVTGGAANVCIGFNAGSNLTTGNGNILINGNLTVASAEGRISIGNNNASVDNGLFFPTTLAELATPTAAASRIVVFDTTTGQTGPIADGTEYQVLQTDGSGILTWTTIGDPVISDGSDNVHTIYNTVTQQIGKLSAGSAQISANITSLTDLTGGAPDTMLNSTFDSVIDNNFASLLERVNAILTLLNAHGFMA
jgi:hypothetical protein